MTAVTGSVRDIVPSSHPSLYIIGADRRCLVGLCDGPDHNQVEIAQAMYEAGVAREHLFITTKIPCTGDSDSALARVRWVQCFVVGNPSHPGCAGRPPLPSPFYMAMHPDWDTRITMYVAPVLAVIH
jgi:hypothetical protein